VSRIVVALVFAAMAGCSTPPPLAVAPAAPSPLQAVAPAAPPPKADPCHAPAGEIETVRPAPNTTYLTADAREIVWTDGRVVHAMADGGAPRVVGRYAGDEDLIKLRLAGDRVFAMASHTDHGRATCKDEILAFPRRGGTATKLVGGVCLRDFDVAADRVVYTRSMGSGGGASGALSTTTFDGVTTTLFEQFDAGPVDVHGRRAYLGLRGGELDSIPWDDVAGTRIFDGHIGDASPGHEPHVVAIDDRGVYVGVHHPRYTALTIFAVDHDAEVEPREIGMLLGPSGASRSPWPRGGLTQTATHLVWSATFRGIVMRLAKSGACPVEDLGIWRATPDFAVTSGKFVYWLEKTGADATIVRRRVEP
jgi:hypothetical protein